MGGSASGGGNQKTTQTSSPWAAQIPYLKYGLDEAARLYQTQGPQYYPGSSVAPFSKEQNQAFALGTQRALNGNLNMKNAAGYANDVLAGKYLNSDPYKDQVFANVKQQVMPAVNAQAMGAGRYGSNLQTDTATRALTEAYAPYASQQYQSGLDRMNWAAGMAPTFAADDWNNLSALEAIGGQKQRLGQNELNDAIARWDYYQRLPYDKLGQFLNNIGGNYGGTVVGKQPSNQPGAGQMIGGGILGLLGLLG